MASVSLIQTNFSAGELSPKLLGRVDYPKYGNGAEKLENMIPLPHGGLTRRPGTQYITEVKDSSKKTRLIRFVFSSVQAYQLEFGDLYIRVYISTGQVESAPSVPLEIVTPYTEDQIWDIQFAQSADVLFLVHPDVAPKVLTRTSLTSWTLSDYDYVDGPYLDINITTTTLTPAATTGTGINVTASSIVGINDGAGFQASDVGRWIRIQHAAVMGWAKITSVTSTTVVVVTIKQAFGATTASANWYLGAWTSVLGWPATIAFYEDRLFFGGNDSEPQKIWGTMSGDYYTHSPTQKDVTVTDDNGVVYGLSSGEVNDIRWLDASKALVAGTASAEFSISGGSSDQALTPSNVKAFAATVRGSAKVLPVRVDSALLFVQKAKRKVREYSYDFGSDSFQAIDLTILSDHITKGKIRELAYQQEPYSVVWVVLENGNLCSLTYSREQEIISWARHPIGGSGKVKSISVVPSPTEEYDELWMIVERTINGVTEQYVEKMSNDFEPTDENDKDNAWFTDSALVYDGVSTSTITGLDHLIGETVSIWANGAIQPDRVVDGAGSIELERATTYAIIGLKNRYYLKTVRYEAGGNEGTAQGKKKRVHRLGIRFLNTSAGTKYGMPGGNYEDVYFREGSHPMNASPPLFTGDKVVVFPGDYDRDGQIEIFGDSPGPCTILAIMPEQVVHG